ncbi:hypothetical protein C3L50_10205 [Flavobacterium alvei]|uniref:Uncharacterized protein n=1 Tax=Flavobacterium alvei TaxID=2080416 RepID=A0A2S5AAI1_9FLAO|nr:hypothetical protein [Flavobacterium alvei]POY39534.1 hypothetical protein C3L50_10205 [Flavobacterium alvei]
MNWIRKTVIFVGLTIVFLFAFSANEVSISNVPLEKQESSLSVEKIHSSAFIEPQASNLLTFSQKNPDLSFSKYLENYLVSIPDLKIGISFPFFANQDINRCEMVSLLLFPFHIFW